MKRLEIKSQSKNGIFSYHLKTVVSVSYRVRRGIDSKLCVEIEKVCVLLVEKT